MIRIKKLTMLMAILATLALGAGTALAVPIPNGNFELGNTAFTSAYTFHDPYPGANAPGEGLWDEGTYGIGTDPFNYHSLWTSFGDHTTGTGNMMIVNGDILAGVEVWASPESPDTIPVINGQTYYFSAWLTSVYPPPVGSDPIAPATLAFSINDVQIDGDFTVSGPVGTWQLFYVGWNSGVATTAQLSLINRNVIASGNDFALDDISLDTKVPVPEPGIMILLGIAMSAIGIAYPFVRKI